MLVLILGYALYKYTPILSIYPNTSLFAQRTKVFTLLTHNGIIRAEHLIITYQQSIFYAASDEKQKWRKTQSYVIKSAP